MANHTVTVMGVDLGGSGFFSISSGGSSSSPIELDQGDTLTVSHSSGSDISGSILVTGWANTIWTNTTTLYVSRGSTGVKTVKSNATHSVTDVITVSRSGYTNGSIYVRINDPTPPADTTPDNFASDLDNVTGANLSQEYFLGSFTVTGINTSVTCSVGGSANTESRVGVDGDKDTTNKTVSNNDVIYIWGDSSSSYSTTTNASVTVGTRTVTKNITTGANPSATTQRIPFPVTSGTISMNDIRQFFGPRLSSASLGNYYRGGSYVPNNTTGSPNNSGVPASGAIDLADFYNSFTTIFFSTAPPNLSGFGFGNDSVVLNWSRNNWEMGFGPDMEDGMDYRITHEVTSFLHNLGSLDVFKITFDGVTRDLTVAGNRSSHTFAYTDSYGGSESAITITCTMSNNGECDIAGTITLQARHARATSYTTSATFTYYINHTSGV